MSQITAETLFHQITSLPLSEKVKLRALLDEWLQNTEIVTNRVKLVKRVLAAAELISYLHARRVVPRGKQAMMAAGHSVHLIMINCFATRNLFPQARR
ncbi:MAG TPA: hypothetical protein VJ810_38790 [Blastocatellia bacterium]|nr:hypothetical protein [Blastocatellia bacterium]